MKKIKPDKYRQTKKLICDWSAKESYLIHYRMLKFYVRNGMELVKVHTLNSYKQSKRLEKFISFNTQKIINANNEIEEDF